MKEVNELYQELIVDHKRHPRNFGILASPTTEASGNNPLCGDTVHLTLVIKDGIIEDIAFEGQGCAISTASASLMTEAIKGRSVEEAMTTFQKFQGMVTDLQDQIDDESLGDLQALAGVRQYPVRVKCATLPWHALKSALQGKNESVTTE